MTRHSPCLFSSLILSALLAGCGGPSRRQPPPGPGPVATVGGPCGKLAPPAPGQVEGLQQYTEGPGEVVRTRIQDLDGDGEQDLLVSAAGYRSATGNVAAALYLTRGTCGRYVGSFWISGDAPRVRMARGKHNGLPVLQVATRMTFKQIQTRYCFDGSVYVNGAERVRHFYDHRTKKLRLVLLEQHWEPWEATANSSCHP